MKLGIIGTGKIVHEFLPQILSVEGIEVDALLSTPRSLQAAKELGAKYGIDHVYDQEAEFFDCPIDTVYIAAPNHLHFPYAKKALEKGLNVIVEKPACSNSREMTALDELANQKGKLLLEAISTRHFPVYEQIRKALPLLGSIRLVRCCYCQYSSRYDAFVQGEILPAFDPAKAGGALMDLNVYNLQFVCGLFGAPQSVDYQAHIERGIDTNGTLLLDYPDFSAVCIAAKDCQAPSNCLIAGSDGWIETSKPANQIGVVTMYLRKDGYKPQILGDTGSGRAVNEFEYFEKVIAANDLEAGKKDRKVSAITSQIQTKARKQAGIVFPADIETPEQ